MDDRLSQDDRDGNRGGGMEGGQGPSGDVGAGEHQGRQGGGNGEMRGRVNTSAWIIGALVVLIAVFAGLRFARVPAPTRPAPTRPAPTVPAPSPTRPAPTAPTAGVEDLERALGRVEDAVQRKDWSAASSEFTTLRSTWESLRPRVTSTNTTKDITTFDARLDELRGDIGAKKEADAKADVTELKAIARRFQMAPTRGTTSG